jgi:hypothetical protein
LRDQLEQLLTDLAAALTALTSKAGSVQLAELVWRRTSPPTVGAFDFLREALR